MNDVVINLSQRGGSHLRPLIAFLNRQFPQGDFVAKSGNVCLRLSTVLQWVAKQAETGLDKAWEGTNRHNHVTMSDLIPVDQRRAEVGWKWVVTDKTSLLADIVWEHQREDVILRTRLLAEAIVNKLN